MNVRPEEQDWTSAQMQEKFEKPPAAEAFHHGVGHYERATDQEKPSPERPSLVEMKTYALSRIHDGPVAQQTHRPACGTFNMDSCSINRPNLRRCRSWLDIQPTCYSLALREQSHPRRWSTCMPDGGGLQYPAGPVFNAPTVARWCGEFREARVTAWQQMVTDFHQVWKRWCFAQRQARFSQDTLIKEAIKHFWQPLSDFNYVLSLYSFLEGVRNPNLLPNSRRTCMTWRSPEQIRFHEGCGLELEEAEPSDENKSSDGMSRDDNPRVMASRYPLTIHQHLCVARICDDVGGELRSLQRWLEEFRTRREACARAIRETGLFNPIMAERQWNLTDAAKEFSSLAKTLTKQLRDSRIRLCEALGLDPKQVPGGDSALVPTMTAMRYEKASNIPSPCHDRLPLPRNFWVKKASLEASRVALKANLYITVMPRKISQKLLGRMLVRSTEMATMAKEVGDYKAEAAMHRLHNKFRKIHERAGREFPDMKPKMTLLDSETWPAVLKPRQSVQVEIHGPISVPVEELIDMLLAPPTPERISAEKLSATGNRPSVESTTMTTEHSRTQRSSGNSQPLTTSSSTTADPEAEAAKD